METSTSQTLPSVDSQEITFVKVRRKETTIYVECGENDLGDLLRTKIAQFFPKEFRVYYKGVMLDYQTNLYSQSVKNGAELFITTKGGFDGGWETLEEVGFKQNDAKHHY